MNVVEGIPLIYSFSTCENSYALVMELLGPNLSELLRACGGNFSVRTVAMIAQQLVNSRMHFSIYLFSCQCIVTSNSLNNA